LFTKNLSWQTKESMPHTTMIFYGACVKMCEDFEPNFSDKRTGCWIMTMHRLTLPFSPGNFWPKTTWLLSPTHHTHLPCTLVTFLFPWLKIKLKGRHFGTTEVNKAESYVVLNTLLEPDLKDAFWKMAETLWRGLLRGLWWPAGPKLVSDQMAVSVQEIMDHGDTIHNLLYLFMVCKALYTKLYI
jgi:hypothetical protein